MDLGLATTGLLVGAIVGLTGVGGGALMTPLLVLFFGIPPLSAVSSDLVTSAAMKPVGSAVHMRHGTVNWGLVRWLAIGSVPSAFAGVLVIRALGNEQQVHDIVQLGLGAALLLAAGSMVLKAYLRLAETLRQRRGEGSPAKSSNEPMRVRPVPTLLIGIMGGFIVGMTSVGSGSLIIISLLFLYPMLTASHLVGTDLVQAVPLIWAAAIGHLLFGSVEFAVTVPLLVGSIPGIFVGAQLSARAPQGLMRRVLSIVLFISGLKMLGIGDTPFIATAVAVVVLGPALWALLRVRHGLPPLVWQEQRPQGGQDDRGKSAGQSSRS